MFYTIYKITNTVNGKFYIGKHQTENLDDGYMGSGKLVKRAIKKYGKDKFKKEILFLCESGQEMDQKEKELVEVGSHTYNLCEGGKGGFGYINKNGLSIMTIDKLNTRRREKISANSEFAQIMVDLAKKANKKSVERLQTLSQEERDQKYENFTFKGKIHSEETRAKMSLAAKGRVPWNKGVPRTSEENRKSEME